MANKKRSKKKKIEKRAKPIVIIIALLLCVAIAVTLSCVKLGRRRVHTEIPLTKAVSEGVDVSEHNGKIDWDRLSDEYDFAFIRVGYRGYIEDGPVSEDRYARKNLAAANSCGIPVGIYVYSQAVTEKEAEEETELALRVARRYDIALPVIIDFEYPTDNSGKEIGRLVTSKNSPRKNAEIINAFIDRVVSEGYTAGVYSSSYVLSSRIALNKVNENAFIWVADYNGRVTYDVDYDIWQFSDKGKCDAVSSKYIDLDYWYK